MSHPDRGLTDFPTLPVLPYLARSGVVWWNLAMWTPPHLFKTLTWQAHSRLAVPFFMNFTMSHPKPVYSSLLHPSMYKNYGPWPRKIPPAVWIFSKPTAPPLDQAAVIPSQGYFSAVFLKLFFFFSRWWEHRFKKTLILRVAQVQSWLLRGTTSLYVVLQAPRATSALSWALSFPTEVDPPRSFWNDLFRHWWWPVCFIVSQRIKALDWLQLVFYPGLLSLLSPNMSSIFPSSSTTRSPFGVLCSDTTPELLTEPSLPGNIPLLPGEFLLIGHNPAWSTFFGKFSRIVWN